jgi:PAS domain-containing protein
MGFNQFGASLALRLCIIMVALSIVGFLVVTPGYHAATLLGLLTTAAFTFEMFKFITKTNQEVTRFLDAARYADFGQRFDFGKLGAGFPQLEQAFTHILERFREDRTEHESELRHLKALLEHVPVPLISIHASNQITLWNNSARRLFGISRVTRLPDLEQFGAEFFKEISSIRAGGNALVTFQVDNMEQRLTISASEITMGSKTERLISLQDI